MPQGLKVGDFLPDVVMQPTPLQLFRYSAVTWNSHKIHFDAAWAAHEGHAGVLVHSHLHAANALRVLTAGLSSEWGVSAASYKIVGPAAAGSTLTATAQITAISVNDDEMSFALRETDEHGRLCLEGTATARLRT